ncbi:MAG: hypothetical protein ABIT36_03040 [Steroidobacteraceae bacterium]
MRIGKPLLAVTTTLGLAIGIYEGFALAGGLGWLLLTLILLFGFAMFTVVDVIRAERTAEQGRTRDEEPAP